jgi:uncharacterized protein YegP (UPF0339 family)
MNYAEIWRSTNNFQWYWHIVGGNHQIIAQSEGYTTKAAAEHGLRVALGHNNWPVFYR